MSVIDQALATQLANIEKRTGKSLAELTAIVNNSELSKHMELVKLLKTSLGMGHGDANTVVHLARRPAGLAAQPSSSSEEVLDALYSGPKAALRPIHDKLLQAMQQLGDFETAPKKAYVSYRRSRQFAMVGPASKARVDVGINMKDLMPTQRLVAMPAGRMCNYTVQLTDANEVDAELMGWINKAYQAAQ